VAPEQTTLTVTQFAARFRVSESTVRRWITKEFIPAQRHGKRTYLIDLAAAQEAIAQRATISFDRRRS
jgi:excisionase family DNA binding protein